MRCFLQMGAVRQASSARPLVLPGVGPEMNFNINIHLHSYVRMWTQAGTHTHKHLLTHKDTLPSHTCTRSPTLTQHEVVVLGGNKRSPVNYACPTLHGRQVWADTCNLPDVGKCAGDPLYERTATAHRRLMKSRWLSEANLTRGRKLTRRAMFREGCNVTEWTGRIQIRFGKEEDEKTLLRHCIYCGVISRAC